MKKLLIFLSLALVCSAGRADTIYDADAWKTTVSAYRTETLNDYQTTTYFPVPTSDGDPLAFSLQDMGNLTSYINTGADQQSTTVDGTPYAFMKLSDNNFTRMLFSDRPTAFGMYLNVGPQQMCDYSTLGKRFFLTSTAGAMHDSVYAIAKIYLDDPAIDGGDYDYVKTIDILNVKSTTAWSGGQHPEARFYGYIAKEDHQVAWVDFLSADPGMCVPLGMDNVLLPSPTLEDEGDEGDGEEIDVSPSVPEPGTLTGLAGLIAVSLVFAGLRRRRRAA